MASLRSQPAASNLFTALAAAPKGCAGNLASMNRATVKDLLSCARWKIVWAAPPTRVYRLSAGILIDEDELGITADDEITRYNVLGQVDFRILDASGQQITGGSVDGFTAYSGTGTPVSTRAARQDARKRLMIILADKITARLLATSGEWRQ